MTRSPTGLLLAVTAALGILSGCGVGEPDPSGTEDVRRAFASEQIRLVQAPDGDDAIWGARLVAPDEDVRLEVLVFVDSEGARNVADSLVSLAEAGIRLPRLGDPAPGSRVVRRVERRGNVLVLVPAEASRAVARRVGRALNALPER